jgi:predicted nucleic acid-binding protein
LTGVADTRLLLTLEFPPTVEAKRQIEELSRREIAKHLLTPSIVLTEFIKVAGPRIGKDGAKTRLRLLAERGVRVVPLEEEQAVAAGDLLLSHQDVPTADALIGSFVKTGAAEYVVTDDPHYKTLGIKTTWF